MSKTGQIPKELKSKSRRGAKLIDLQGMKFGKWKVIKFAERRGITRQYMWFCVCDCGTEREVCGARLRNKTSTSCGCNQSKKHLEHFERSRKKYPLYYGIE
jgi:hypothetical protein